MGISDDGEKAMAAGAPVSTSSRAAFTDEDPISKPNTYLPIMLLMV
jgi:hypothetical protein